MILIKEDKIQIESSSREVEKNERGPNGNFITENRIPEMKILLDDFNC